MKTSYQVSDASLKRLRALAIEARNPFDAFSQWAEKERFCKYTYWEALEKACCIDPLLLSATIRKLRDKQEKLDLVARTFDMLKGETTS